MKKYLFGICLLSGCFMQKALAEISNFATTTVNLEAGSSMTIKAGDEMKVTCSAESALPTCLLVDQSNDTVFRYAISYKGSDKPLYTGEAYFKRPVALDAILAVFSNLKTSGVCR